MRSLNRWWQMRFSHLRRSVRAIETFAHVDILPVALSLGAGKFALDLGVNVWGLVTCTTGYLVGASWHPGDETLNAVDQPASAKRDPERASSIRKGEAAGSDHSGRPIGGHDGYIEHLMDQHGLTRADMVPILGTPSRVSEVLRGKKELSMAMVQRLLRQGRLVKYRL
jgi:hypothetical protein